MPVLARRLIQLSSTPPRLRTAPRRSCGRSDKSLAAVRGFSTRVPSSPILHPHPLESELPARLASYWNRRWRAEGRCRSVGESRATDQPYDWRSKESLVGTKCIHEELRCTVERDLQPCIVSGFVCHRAYLRNQPRSSGEPRLAGDLAGNRPATSVAATGCKRSWAACGPFSFWPSTLLFLLPLRSSGRHRRCIPRLSLLVVLDVYRN